MVVPQFTELSFDKTNWAKTKFGDVVIEVRDSVKNPIEAGIDRIIGLEHIDPENIHIRSWGSIEDGATFTRLFKPDQMLFGRRRAYLKKAGLATFEGVCSGDIIVMEAKEGLLPSLLPFLVNNDTFFDYAVKTSAGSLSPRTKFKYLANYDFLLPPIDQQAKIAELLWALDEVIEKVMKTTEKQDSMFSAYCNSIFSIEKGKSKDLIDLGELTMGQSPPGTTYNEIGEGMPFLQGNAEFGKVNPVHFKYTTDPKKIVAQNTILISVRAPVGDLNIADKTYCIGRGLAGLYIENDSLRSYVYNFLRFSRYELDKHSTGSTFKAINKAALSTIKIVIPTELELIDNSNNLKKLINSKERLEIQIASSKTLQKSLINKVF